MRSVRRVVAATMPAAVVLALAACSPTAVLSTVSPSRHYERTADLRYGDESRQTLDVYVPVEAAAKAPLIIFFYGGGWRSGAKEQYEFVASSLTKAGMVVVIPDYRLYPDVRFPDFVEDGAAAAAFAVENATRFGADPANVFVMGHSAGAHIAAMIALNASYMSLHGSRPGEVFAGLIGLSGPYDFLPLEQGYLRDVFPRERRAESQPINFVTDAAPPSLLIHGTDDDTVYLRNSANLAAKLRANGVDVVLKKYAGVGHVRVVATLAPPLDFLSDTLEDTKAFIDERCRRRPCGSAPK